jgi:fructose-bisphosphate aldolase class II
MLVSPRDILLPAFREGRLTGAFNTGNMEMTMGILRAAEDTNTPVLLQIAEKRLPHSPLALMGPLMVSAARRAKVPVAVQLDHGESEAVIAEALDCGFTGIMYDGSALPPEENAAQTRRVRAMCERHGGAWLEGEIGVLAGSEGGPEAKALHSDPAQARRYADEAGCDALAVSIGNAHGHYKGKPKLNFAALEEIHALLPAQPLVLHGGTGIPKEDLARAVRQGICKVNIATASFDALYQAARNAPQAEDYFGLSTAMAGGVYENTRRLLGWFAALSNPDT